MITQNMKKVFLTTVLMSLTSVSTFAQNGGNAGGGGDPQAQEFSTMMRKVMNYIKTEKLEIVTFSEQAAIKGLHQIQTSLGNDKKKAVIEMTSDEVLDANGTKKAAVTSFEPLKIRVNLKRWEQPTNKDRESVLRSKVILAGMELLKVASITFNRYETAERLFGENYQRISTLAPIPLTVAPELMSDEERRDLFWSTMPTKIRIDSWYKNMPEPITEPGYSKELVIDMHKNAFNNTKLDCAEKVTAVTNGTAGTIDYGMLLRLDGVRRTSSPLEEKTYLMTRIINFDSWENYAVASYIYDEGRTLYSRNTIFSQDSKKVFAESLKSPSKISYREEDGTSSPVPGSGVTLQKIVLSPDAKYALEFSVDTYLFAEKLVKGESAGLQWMKFKTTTCLGKPLQP